MYNTLKMKLTENHLKTTKSINIDFIGWSLVIGYSCWDQYLPISHQEIRTEAETPIDKFPISCLKQPDKALLQGVQSEDAIWDCSSRK